jgi:RNA polymerase sigma-70 factor (ECF subfamily)
MALKQDIVVQLLLMHRGKLVGAIRAMVGDEHLAEDIFQEVSIAAVSKCEEIESIEHFGGWLRCAARFQGLIALRNRNRLPRSLSPEVMELLEAHWQHFDAKADIDIAETLRNCIEKLGPYAKQVIVTRYDEGKQGTKLADAMNRNVQAVYKALTRAHSALRKCIQDRLAASGTHG